MTLSRLARLARLARSASYRLLPAVLLLGSHLILPTGHAQVNVTEFESNYWDYASPFPNEGRQAQRRWWTQIGAATGGDPAGMARLFTSKDPRFFSRSCEQPLIPGDYERLQTAFATVLASGFVDPATAGSPSEPRGRFLACLANSGAEPLKLKIAGRLIEWTTSSTLRYTPVTCGWKQTVAGASMVAATGHWVSGGQIRWYGNSALEETRSVGYYPADQAGSTATTTFANIALHELIHTIGYSGEELAYTAVACCGDVVADRARACRSLDTVIARDKAANLLSRSLGQSDYFSALRPPFPSDDASRLAQRFYRQLAIAVPELAGADERNACVARSGRAACQAKAAAALREALAAIFPVDCVNLVAGGSADLCAMVKDGEQKALVRAMTERLFATR